MSLKRFQLTKRTLSGQSVEIEQDIRVDENEPFLGGRTFASHCRGPRALSQVRFVEDPIAGVRYSRATSIVSSAYKRHGRILEYALRESLRESNRHQVWNDERFRVSRE